MASEYSRALRTLSDHELERMAIETWAGDMHPLDDREGM